MEKVRLFNPQIEWRPCDPDAQMGGTLVTSCGILTVPSDYYASGSPRLRLQIQRFTHPSTSVENKPKAHLIFLCGGPGIAGRCADHKIRDVSGMAGAEIAYYNINHRGTAETSFTDLPITQAMEQLDSIVASGPFPLKDLTTENAALDVAALSLAIQGEPMWRPDAKLALSGSSYGSRLAHAALTLAPSLYHVAFLNSVSEFGSLPMPSDNRLLEHCQRDCFCSEKMGNVEESIRSAINAISDPETQNECAAFFQSTWLWSYRPKKMSRGKWASHLAYRLLDLYYMGSIYVGSSWISGAQLALTFVKSTNDCVDPHQYKTHIFPKIALSLPRVLLPTIHGVPGNVNIFAHYVIWCSSILNPEKRKHYLHTPEDYNNLSTRNIHNYRVIWKRLAPFMRSMRYLDEEPLQSETTEVYISASMADMVTPPGAGWELYRRMRVKRKGWLYYHHRGHDGYWGDCQVLLYLSTLLPASHGDKFDRLRGCLQGENARRRLDWSFASLSWAQSMWQQMRRARAVGRCKTTSALPLTDCRTIDDPMPPAIFEESDEWATRAVGRDRWRIAVVLGAVSGLLIATIITMVVFKRSRTKSTSTGR